MGTHPQLEEAGETHLVNGRGGVECNLREHEENPHSGTEREVQQPDIDVKSGGKREEPHSVIGWHNDGDQDNTKMKEG
jgi:hypothetical protein